MNQYSCEWDSSLHSVSPLNGRRRAKSACYHTGCQWSHERCSEAVEVRISCVDSSLTNHFFTHGSSPDTFVNAMDSTQKDDSAIVTPACSFASSFLWVTKSRGNQWVGMVFQASRIHSSKIETTKITFDGPEGFSAKFCTIESFPLHGITH